MFHILNNIYLSNHRDAHDIRLINAKKIDIVIRLSENINDSIYEDDIEFINFEIEDNCLYKTELIDFSKYIRGIITANPTKNILIYCDTGQSTSVSVIIFYMMTTYKCKFDFCRDYIKCIKPDIKPNDAFESVLRTFE